MVREEVVRESVYAGPCFGEDAEAAEMKAS